MKKKSLHQSLLYVDLGHTPNSKKNHPTHFATHEDVSCTQEILFVI